MVTDNEYEPILIDKWQDPTTQRGCDGKKRWTINTLIAEANKLPAKEMPLEHLNIATDTLDGKTSLRAFATHMRAVNDCDDSFPIILDEDGWIMDGRHRVTKALVEGKTHIKFVRFKKNPEPDYYEESSNE